MSCMTLHIRTHRSHGHGVAVMLEDEKCPCSMKHVSSGQPVIEHIESNPAVLLKSPQTVWSTGLVNYFDILLHSGRLLRSGATLRNPQGNR